MLHCIVRRTGTWECGTFTTQVKPTYRDRSRLVQLLLQLEIMQNNVETQHKHMYSLYIVYLVVCVLIVAFPMTRFICIETLQVFVEIWMRWSIALSSAFYRGRKHLWVVFSFKIPHLVLDEENWNICHI